MGPPGGRGPSRGYAVLNGAGATRSWGISSPCCSRFERRVLSLAHALVGTVVCASAGVLPKYWNTWLGHIGPAGVMFIISELERFPGGGWDEPEGGDGESGGRGCDDARHRVVPEDPGGLPHRPRRFSLGPRSETSALLCVCFVLPITLNPPHRAPFALPRGPTPEARTRWSPRAGPA